MKIMEQNKNGWPEIKVIDPIDRLTKVLHFIFDHIHCEGLSEHNRGAAVELDKAIFDNPQQKLW